MFVGVSACHASKCDDRMSVCLSVCLVVLLYVCVNVSVYMLRFVLVITTSRRRVDQQSSLLYDIL